MKIYLLILVGLFVSSCSQPSQTTEPTKDKPEDLLSVYDGVLQEVKETSGVHTIDEQIKALSSTPKEHKEYEATQSYIAELKLEQELIKKEGLKIFEGLKAEKGEFDEITFYKPKSSPKYINANGFYLYFGIEDANDVPEVLRLKIQYYDEDWLFLKNFKLKADSTLFSYPLNNVKRDNGSGKIWEWVDLKVDKELYRMCKSIADSKEVKIKFNGSEYYDNRKLSKTQIKSIKDILLAYRYKGGKEPSL